MPVLEDLGWLSRNVHVDDTLSVCLHHNGQHKGQGACIWETVKLG